ncbi:MAG: alpha-2-macroglobulin [Verrucomicrobiaceae bacterium]|nr:alpha-2-macroglobulin [Verrucomicrobiaceae bacterium]
MNRWLVLVQPRFWKRVARVVFGDVNYTPPAWAVTGGRAVFDSMRRRPDVWAATVCTVGLLSAGGWHYWKWWEEHRPHERQFTESREITGKLSAPGVTPVVKGKAKPDGITITFSAAAAPLDAIGKPDAKGVSLSPAQPGSWTWSNDKTLVFQTTADWPAGTDYKVTLDKSVLPKEAKLKDSKWEFTTAAMTPKLASLEFYTDPKEPAVHQIVAEITTTHPVKREEIEKRVSLEVLGKTPIFDWQGKPPASLFTVTEGKDQRQFWVRSARIAVPAKEDFVRFTLAAGLTSLTGGKAADKPLVDKVRVPDVFSGFSISGVKTEIVRTEEGEPEQFLFVDTSGYAEPEEITKQLEVWLLPKDKPKEKDNAVVEDYAWSQPGEVTPAIMKLSQRVKLKPVDTEKSEDAPVSTRHAFKMLIERPGYLLTKIAAGTQALGGFKLKNAYQQIANVPEFPREIEVMGKGGLLALNGEKKLSLKSRGAKHIRYAIGRVPAGQVNHLASMTAGDFEAPEFRTSIFDEENLARIKLDVKPSGWRNDYQANYTTFDFTSALQAADPSDPDASRGLFFFGAEGVEPAENVEEANAKDPDADWNRMDENFYTRRFILVTDLGLLVKRNADATREVFVQSISKGEPVAGASVKIIAKNGEFLAEATTGPDGHVHFDSVEGLERHKQPVAIIARLGNDVSFIPFKRPDRLLDFSRFDTGGVLASQNETLDAFLFTERGVYRPGDKIHVGGIVRRRDWEGKLEGMPLEIRVIDAKNAVLYSDKIPLTADGFIEWDAETADTDPTGKYAVELHLVRSEDDRERIGRTVIRVEDFQPDRMKMTVAFNTPKGLAWVQPRDVRATLDLQTLFGFPAADRKVKAKIELNAASFAFEQFPDFTFHNRAPSNFQPDENSDSEAGKTVELGEQKTNADGKAEFDLALERFEGGSFFMNFLAEGFEADGGRSVRAAQSMLVAPLPYVAGYKADGALDYIGKDTQRGLRLIAVGPDLKPIAQPGLTYRIIQIKHVSVLTKQDSGSYAYVSTKRESAAGEGPLPLAADGANFALPTANTGEFRFELRDGENHVVCACPFTVVGKGDMQRSLERDAELGVKLARENWNSGDPLEMSLNAPYTGAGLITIERERVLGWQWFKSPTPASTQRITVPGGFEGTGYVNVSFVRALDSPEVFMSPLSYAVQPFTANPDKRKMLVEIDAPRVVKPGEMMKIGYKAAKPSRIVVYAVDEGIHQITDYKLPQPLTHFFRKRALETETEQLLDLILPEFSLISRKAYGGDEDGALKMNLNPFKRRKEAPVVFWSGLVEAGPDRREVSYDVPDYFAGGLKIMAVAVAADAIGAAETKSIVRGPFVLTPNVPTFAAPGDEFVASLTIANNLEGANAPSGITLQATASEHLEIIGQPQMTIDVAPGKETTVRFRVKARDSLGGAELLFTASGGGQSLKRSATLSVRPAAPYLTNVQSGWFRLPKQDVKITRDLYPHFRKAEATVSALPIGLARGLESYLAEYPHGCSEQVTSRAMSRLLLATEADFGFDQAEATKQLDAAFSILYSRQDSKGGFGYWDDRADGGIDFLSVYVTHFLTEAREANFAVPSDLLDGARGRMKLMARTKITSLEDAEIQAAAIYLLTRNGEVTTNFLLNLRDSLEKDYKGKWQNTLAAAYMAGTYVLLKQEKEGRSLMQSYWSSADKQPKLDRWRGWYHRDPKIKQTQGFALLCRHFPDLAAKLKYEDLAMITEPITRNSFNTISAAYSILALKAYSKLVQKSDLKLSISQLPTQGEPRLLLPEGGGLRTANFDPGISGLRFHLDQGKLDIGAFYQVTEAGFDKGLPTTTIADGLEVFRDLSDKDGKATAKLKVGESATVTIRVRNNSPDELTNIAVLDLMPGGFELEPNGLKPGRDTVPGADYVDVREDRNVFFTGLSKGQSKSFIYRIKPVCAGKFAVPPVFAESMYDRGTKGRAGGGTVEVAGE